MNRSASRALALCVVLLWCCLAVPAAEKAPPGGPERNLVNTTDKDVVVDFNVEDGMEKNVLWKARLGKNAYGGPTVAEGKVFVGTNNEQPRDPAIKDDKGVLMCFDQKTGRFLWQMVHDKLPGGEAVDGRRLGIGSMPSVVDGHVYYVSNRCELVCLDARGDPSRPGKARVVWSLDMHKELKVFPCQLAVCSPVVAGDLVFTLTGNGIDIEADPPVLPSPDAPSFIAVNKKTGKVVWTSKLPGKNIMEGQWTNPTYAVVKGKPQVLFPGGDGWLYSLEPQTGKVIWKFFCNPKSSQYDYKRKRNSDRCYFVATPVVHDDKVYIGVGCNPEDGPGVGHFWCIDMTKTGDVSPVDDDFDPKSPKNKDSALVWHFGGKVPKNVAPGDRDVIFGRTLSTVAIHEGLVYLGELDGFLHCLDAKTGQKYWEHDMKTSLWSSPYVVAGKVLIGNDDGDLLVFRHGKKYVKPEAVTVGPPLQTPVQVSDGILYIQTSSTLYAIGNKK